MHLTSFQTGDLVALKSGGPSMTVQDINEREEGIFLVLCKWFIGNKSFVEEFAIESLKPSPGSAGLV